MGGVVSTNQYSEFGWAKHAICGASSKKSFNRIFHSTDIVVAPDGELSIDLHFENGRILCVITCESKSITIRGMK
jgi:hypothetical protein